MSRQISQLLEAFEALPEAEFLRRAIPFDSGPLDDEETAYSADALFATLDQEEDDTGSRDRYTGSIS